MGTNYETAESYLESIINSSIETAANELATDIARRDAEKITNFTSTAANRKGDNAIVARDVNGKSRKNTTGKTCRFGSLLDSQRRRFKACWQEFHD